MKCVHIPDWKANYIGIHKLDQALTAAFLLKPSTKHTGILHRNMPQQNLRLSVSMIFIQYSVVDRESKFETRKFDRERKWFVPLILNNAFLEPGCIRLTWPMITRQTRARKQNGYLLRKNSWTTGSDTFFGIFEGVHLCRISYVKKFIENEYFVRISWTPLNKIKYLQCTRSNFKSNEKQTALWIPSIPYHCC